MDHQEKRTKNSRPSEIFTKPETQIGDDPALSRRTDGFVLIHQPLYRTRDGGKGDETLARRRDELNNNSKSLRRKAQSRRREFLRTLKAPGQVDRGQVGSGQVESPGGTITLSGSKNVAKT